MADLRDQLIQALGPTYRIENELGGGGMSRVFLAEEVALSRQVVIKVLPPEMAASVNQDRFRREIQLAARLQHPHIVPLLTAGASGDLLYYVMPFIKGESLRAKLEREHELPIGEVVRILREVTDALAYAHSEGVVHRDIKPDNVMISGGHALVTDFGVAKAVSEATGSHSLTSFGLAIGTPAYMAPEQASGDPHVDHRADLYALGAMAFEMLAGRTPFIGRNPQALLAAHVTQTPESVSQLRPAVPAGLNTVVMRCLEKRAADRWQTATELLPYFDLLLTPSTGGTAPTNAVFAISTGTEAALRRTRPARVLAMYSLASMGALFVMWLLVQQIGLPSWVLFAAIGLLIIGLPIVVLTGRRERQLALARTTNTYVPEATGVQRFFTWRRALTGGTFAFAGLGALAAVYTAMRLLGIGAVGTLMAKGTLNARDRIVMADFENRTSDSTLATTVTELLRTDLAQSSAVSVYDAAQLSTVMARMQLPRETRVTFDIAKDVATREGVKAVLAGEIASLGSAYILSARLIATSNGDVLWAERENVANANGLSAAIDRLAGALRERVGESLRSIRADPPLDQMTTSSTEALRLYAQAERAENAGDNDGARGLLERAIGQDSSFAMAYRKLGILLRNKSFRDSLPYHRAFRRAYDLRDRLSTRERYLTEAAYYSSVLHDTTQAITAYKAVLDRYPDDRAAGNNLAFLLSAQGKKREALTIYRNTIKLGVAPAATYTNAITIAPAIEGLDSTGVLIAAALKAFPENPNLMLRKADWFLATEQIDSAKSIFEKRRDATRGNVQAQGPVLQGLLNVTNMQGRFEEFFAVFRELIRMQFDANGPPPAMAGAPPRVAQLPAPEFVELQVIIARADYTLGILNDTAKALGIKEQELARFPIGRRGPDNQGDDFAVVAEFYARANKPALAHQYWTKWEASVKDSVRTRLPDYALRTRAEIARADGRFDDALKDLRLLREKVPECEVCYLLELSQVFEASGQIDSAVVQAERSYAVPRLSVRAYTGQIERLARLYDRQHDSANAIRHYQKVSALWNTADAPLQPRVAAARERIKKLSASPASPK